MARKRSKRNRYGYTVIKFSTQLALGTLADETVLKTALIGTSPSMDYYIISIDCAWALRDFTANEGPVLVGFAHNDLSVTEIDESLGASQGWEGDIIQKEMARRPVRTAGIFPGSATTEVDLVLNDGRELRTPMKFTVESGKDIALWAKNKSGAALTSGTFVEVEGRVYARRR